MNPNLKLAAAALGGIAVTLAAGGIAFAGMDPNMGRGLGHFRGADADKNGEITRAEWLQAAGTGFDRIDANKDGKLVVGEIPPERRGGPRHGPRHGPDGPGGDDWDRGDAPAAVPAALPENAVQAN